MRYPMPMCVCVRVCVFVCVCSQARCCSPHCYLCITPAGTLLLASRDGRAGLEACLSLLRAQRCLVEVGLGLGLGLGLGCLVEVGRKLIRKAPLLLTYYLPTHLPLTCSHHYSPGGPPLLHRGRPNPNPNPNPNPPLPTRWATTPSRRSTTSGPSSAAPRCTRSASAGRAAHTRPSRSPGD